jgi:pimeloyl-ACP methyl ester carboxylesterase
MSVQQREIQIHGRRLAYKESDGDGPTILLVHGITNSSETWAPVTERLAERGRHVIAVDLPGHGNSERQRGDHSLGAHASVLRDFLSALEVDSATVVGHSLGGGVVMQFSYQFPEMIDRLVLVNSGGLGREVNIAIRAATLPLAEQVIGIGASEPVTNTLGSIGKALGRVGIKIGGDFGIAMHGMASLSDRERREAFVRTARSVISPRGQRVSATDKLYLAADVPTLLIHGDHDGVIPCAHSRAAAELMPGSRLEIFEKSGHFPQCDEPNRFVAVLADFIETTEPARYDISTARKRILEHNTAA